LTADAQLQLAEVELLDISVHDPQLVGADASSGVGEVQVPAPIADRCLAADADRIAARTSAGRTRRQHASIYRGFATWVRSRLRSLDDLTVGSPHRRVGVAVSAFASSLTRRKSAVRARHRPSRD
jgi:hypothetical protein